MKLFERQKRTLTMLEVGTMPLPCVWMSDGCPARVTATYCEDAELGRGAGDVVGLVWELAGLEEVLYARGVLEVPVRLLERGNGVVGAEGGAHLWKDCGRRRSDGCVWDKGKGGETDMSWWC